MRVLYVGMNAKYIHTNPAIRILKRVSEKFADADFLECNINEDTDAIIEKILTYHADMIGFSCYIWNIEKIKLIASSIKASHPHIILFAGGPEVSYGQQEYPFHYILKGDGEKLVEDFISKLKTNPVPVYIQDMSKVPFIGDLYTKDDYQNKVIYMEASRGCPFQCSYCLASVQSNVVIFKEEERVISELKYYLDHGAQTIKFLDRSFNVNPQRFMRFLAFLKTLTSEHVFQFEIAADLLTDEVMDYLDREVKPGQVRLEIGVQSTMDKANQAVNRFSDTQDVLAKIKRMVANKKVVVHADLIVGLPYEDYAHAQNSFNELFLTYPHEIQLGFLKLLKGTPLELDIKKYHYEFNHRSPYEIIANEFINQDELKAIHRAEKGLEALWNKKRLVRTITYLVDSKTIIPYDFFKLMGDYIFVNNIKREVDFYKMVYDWAQSNHYPLSDWIKHDYLMKNNVRPFRFWGRETQSYPSMRLDILKLKLLSETELEGAFISEASDGYFIIIYQPQKRILRVKNGLLVSMD